MTSTLKVKKSVIQMFIGVFFCLSPIIHAVTGPVTEVKPLMGRPTFHVNGEPFTKPLFATYVPTEYYYKQMAEVGCEVFNFQTNCSACNIGFSIPTWKGPDQWDFSQIDQRAGNILKAKPDALIMPRIYIGTPKWWRDKHPEEMVVLNHGGTTYIQPYNEIFDMQRPYASIVSEKWREDMGNALRKTLEHIHNSEYGSHIFGYEIAALGSEEWYYLNVNQHQLGGYSEHTKKAFRKWLKEKYKTVEKLQQVWNQNNLTFDTVEVPSKEDRIGDEQMSFRIPETDMHVIDFYLYYNDAVADTIDYFAGIVKEFTEQKKVVGAFYNYMFEFRGNPEFGHNAGTKIMRSDHVDFICAPPSYHERQLGSGAECYRRPFLPGTLHNKIWFHDNDLASFRFVDVMKRHNMSQEALDRTIAQIHPTFTAQESVWLYQRAAGFVLCEGIYESFFDLHGGYFDHPRLLHEVKKVAEAIDRGKYHDRSSVAEILVLADEVSQAYNTFVSDYPQKPFKHRINLALLDHQLGFIKSGAPYDTGLLSDLELIDFDQYKLIVFLNTWNVSESDRALINRSVKKDEKLVVWLYAPGFFKTNSTSAEYMEELTEICVLPSKDETFIEPKIRLTDTGSDWMDSYQVEPLTEDFGMDGNICRLFYVDDPEVQNLAVLKDTRRVTMAMKKLENWTSVYCMSPVLPSHIVRTLAKQAGVHLFIDTDDTLYANASYITINAASMGRKRVSLPKRSDVYDVIDNALLYKNVESFEEPLMEKETRIYRYQAK